jgi:hypothetical protein
MEETLSRMRNVDELIGKIRLNVDRMSALSDSEVANILARLDVFEEQYRRQSDYLRPDPIVPCVECGHPNDDNIGQLRCQTCTDWLVTE